MCRSSSCEINPVVTVVAWGNEPKSNAEVVFTVCAVDIKPNPVVCNFVVMKLNQMLE